MPAKSLVYRLAFRFQLPDEIASAFQLRTKLRFELRGQPLHSLPASFFHRGLQALGPGAQRHFATGGQFLALCVEQGRASPLQFLQRGLVQEFKLAILFLDVARRCFHLFEHGLRPAGLRFQRIAQSCEFVLDLISRAGHRLSQRYDA